MRVAVRQEEAHKITQRLADGEDPAKLAQEFDISEDMVLSFKLKEEKTASKSE